MNKHPTAPSKPPGRQTRTISNAPAAAVGLWIARAACATADPEIFFPVGQESDTAAKEYCARCPVRGSCLDYALTAGEEFGVWGGLNEGERKAILAGAEPKRSASPVSGAA